MRKFNVILLISTINIKQKKSILLPHLNDHVCSLKSLCKIHYSLCTELKQLTGKFLYLIINHISISQYKEQLALIKIKNKKLKKFIQNYTPTSKYKVPIINLFNYELSDIERKELEMDLEYSFVDKNKQLKQQLAVNMETVSHSAIKYIEDNKVEDFHEFLRACTDIFMKFMYATKDFTYRSVKNMINNDKLAVVSGGKDSCVIIMTKEDYNNKLEAMLNDGISKGIYAPTKDTTLRDLKLFQDFLCKNFKDKYDYEEIRPVSHEPGKLYTIAKTHKFNLLDNITVDNLKFHPTILQIGSYTYNASRVISQYLKSLCENEYKINDTQIFASISQVLVMDKLMHHQFVNLNHQVKKQFFA